MIHEYAILYFEINLFSFVLIGIILHKTRGLSKMVAQRNFAMSIIAEMVFFASDTIFVLVNEGVMPGNSIVLMTCKEVYFFSTALMCFFWFLYFEYLRQTNFARKRINVIRSSSIIWLMLLLLAANLVGRFLFYVDNDGVYHRGPLFVLTYVLSYSYIVVAFVRTVIDIVNDKEQDKNSFLIKLALFPIAPGIAGVLQFVYPRLPVACVAMSITTLVLYLLWTDQLISLDPLTGLNNRKQLNHVFENMIRNHTDNERMCLYLIDANHFKRINDTYGHLQGDKALRLIADSMRLSCKGITKGTILARYGGDEFVILTALSGEDEGMDLKQRIVSNLAEIAAREKLPFELTVSVGMAYAEKSESLKELMEKADEAMYLEKKQL
jgi:diguanylate cyclase (GGDEF)-like protein